MYSSTLCIGCGVCAASCPNSALKMTWDDTCRWKPQVDQHLCKHCGLCVRVCPFSKENHKLWVEEFHRRGIQGGLEGACRFGIGWTLSRESRFGSPSGGLGVEILKEALATGKIDGVLAPTRVMAKSGQLHNEVRILKTPEEVEQSRGSFYEPVCFDNALREMAQSEGRFAIVGTSCLLKALSHAPERIASRIQLRIGLMCSHNVTGQFMDCIAKSEGIRPGSVYEGNLRAKDSLMKQADAYYNTFREANGMVHHRDRYTTAFTRLWRSYCFAQECCLYCPDFFAKHADVSLKDAWGTLGKNEPFGSTLAVVRSPNVSAILDSLSTRRVIHWEDTKKDDILASQHTTAEFKQCGAFERLAQRSSGLLSMMLKKKTWKEHGVFLARSRFSHLVYRIFGSIPLFFSGKTNAHSNPQIIPAKPALTSSAKAPLRVLITGGYGYGNVGDEAQLNACINHWRHVVTDARITVLTPDQIYTSKIHNIETYEAPRCFWFGATESNHYNLSDMTFKLWFPLVAFLETLRTFSFRFPFLRRFRNSLYHLKKRLSLFRIKSEQNDNFINLLKSSDVLHFCGGGYLTGMTISRLWEGMLLCRLAYRLKTKIIMSGQTIGEFKDYASKCLAKRGFQCVDWIYLRDANQSLTDLAKIEISGNHIQATFDDALFCESASQAELNMALTSSGFSPPFRYISVNFHYWGQPDSLRGMITQHFAQICDEMSRRLEAPILLVPMHISDIQPLNDLMTIMECPAKVLNYDYDFRIAKSAITNSECCLTFKHHPIIFAMSASIPTLSVTLDSYYDHKNKGALTLFGQEQWCIDKNTFWDKNMCLAIVADFVANIPELKGQIHKHIEKMRSRDGEAIWRSAIDLWEKGKIGSRTNQNCLINETINRLIINEELRHMDGEAIWHRAMDLWKQDKLISYVNRNALIKDAIHRLIINKWRKWKQQNGILRVALYGAGSHTKWLVKFLNGVEGPTIIRILDDNPRSDQIDDIPIILSSSEDALKDIDSIVVSSDINETEMLFKLRKLYPTINVLLFYDGNWGKIMGIYNPKEKTTDD